MWIISKIFRIRVSNFSPNFDKPKFVELLNSMFSDIKSIDFQPRYNEKGRLFGFVLFFGFMSRFVTFTSEIGYNECLQLGTYTFGDDVLRIEPGQDKGTMPTSVYSSMFLSSVDHPRFKERSSHSVRKALPGMDRFFLLFLSIPEKADYSAAFLHLYPHQNALQIARILWNHLHPVSKHRRRGHRTFYFASIPRRPGDISRTSSSRAPNSKWSTRKSRTNASLSPAASRFSSRRSQSSSGDS